LIKISATVVKSIDGFRASSVIRKFPAHSINELLGTSATLVPTQFHGVQFNGTSLLFVAPTQVQARLLTADIKGLQGNGGGAAEIQKVLSRFYDDQAPSGLSQAETVLGNQPVQAGSVGHGLSLARGSAPNLIARTEVPAHLPKAEIFAVAKADRLDIIALLFFLGSIPIYFLSRRRK
jgi:hypothetical protein